MKHKKYIFIFFLSIALNVNAAYYDSDEEGGGYGSNDYDCAYSAGFHTDYKTSLSMLQSIIDKAKGDHEDKDGFYEEVQYKIRSIFHSYEPGANILGSFDFNAIAKFDTTDNPLKVEEWMCVIARTLNLEHEYCNTRKMKSQQNDKKITFLAFCKTAHEIAKEWYKKEDSVAPQAAALFFNAYTRQKKIKTDHCPSIENTYPFGEEEKNDVLVKFYKQFDFTQLTKLNHCGWPFDGSEGAWKTIITTTIDRVEDGKEITWLSFCDTANKVEKKEEASHTRCPGQHYATCPMTVAAQGAGIFFSQFLRKSSPAIKPAPQGEK